MEGEQHECERCGLCCIEFADKIEATREDMQRWLESGRMDILRHFMVYREDDSNLPVRADALRVEDLPDVTLGTLRDPQSGRLYEKCPFLDRVQGEEERFACAIHITKPEICQNYYPWEWEKRHHNMVSLRCPVVKKRM